MIGPSPITRTGHAMDSPTASTTEHWQFDHLSLLTSPQDSTVNALADLLELRPGYRPPFPFAGRWFYGGDQASLHVIDNASGLPAHGPATVISHIAFRSNASVRSVQARLVGIGKPYRMVRIPESQTVQFFVQMTEGLLIELDVPARPDDPTLAEYRSPEDAPHAV